MDRDRVLRKEAARAGDKRYGNCTLIIVEEKSATSFVSFGAEEDFDYYGVFPLQGKLKNVRGTPKPIKERQEKQAPKPIEEKPVLEELADMLGIKKDTDYDQESVKDLRYQRIIMMMDQDVDGVHIKGLLINFFNVTYLSLLKVPGFLNDCKTPICMAVQQSNVLKTLTITQEELNGRMERMKH
ncbi:DNA topoisomerase II, eukaryotic-type [Corchorus capsularis]|uniref:DNA topoisomerase (ATP-hydrolyzing) n=1 Tax=Corchorus capsularis TaxID=210143 RepID=A0A1R3GYF6_COCAP|nr:DNA topoisomerase II, eukaryotic-type [Corchorus capsularis]